MIGSPPLRPAQPHGCPGVFFSVSTADDWARPIGRFVPADESPAEVHRRDLLALVAELLADGEPGFAVELAL